MMMLLLHTAQCWECRGRLSHSTKDLVSFIKKKGGGDTSFLCVYGRTFICAGTCRAKTECSGAGVKSSHELGAKLVLKSKHSLTAHLSSPEGLFLFFNFLKLSSVNNWVCDLGHTVAFVNFIFPTWQFLGSLKLKSCDADVFSSLAATHLICIHTWIHLCPVKNVSAMRLSSTNQML